MVKPPSVLDGLDGYDFDSAVFRLAGLPVLSRGTWECLSASTTTMEECRADVARALRTRFALPAAEMFAGRDLLWRFEACLGEFDSAGQGESFSDWVGVAPWLGGVVSVRIDHHGTAVGLVEGFTVTPGGVVVSGWSCLEAIEGQPVSGGWASVGGGRFLNEVSLLVRAEPAWPGASVVAVDRVEGDEALRLSSSVPWADLIGLAEEVFRHV